MGYIYRAHATFIDCDWDDFTGDDTPVCAFQLNGGNGDFTAIGCDFSAINNLSSGFFYFASSEGTTVTLENCSLPTGETLTYNLPAGCVVNMYNTIGNTLVDRYYEDYYGIVSESTSVYLAASDGTTSYSYLFDPGSNGLIEQTQGLRFLVGCVPDFDATAGDQIKVNIVYDSATRLQDDEIWLDVEYMDDTTSQSLWVDTLPGLDGTPANLTANSESWTGTSGMTNEQTEHLITSAISDGKAGPAKVWLVLTKDQDVYVCPDIVVV